MRDVARWIRARAEAPFLAVRLPRSTSFAFTADFITWQIPVWQRFLSPMKGQPNLQFLEIGSFEGRSAVWLLDNVLTHPAARLTCVDPFHQRAYEMRFDHNMRISGHAGQVIKLRGPSAEVLASLKDAAYQCIYVDGSHRAVDALMDAMQAWRLLEPGGILIFDDYEWEPERPPLDRPKLAVDLFLAALEGRYDVLHREYQVILRKCPVTSNRPAT